MDKKRIGFISLFGSAFLYGFYGILSRLIAFHIPLFYGSFFRNCISTIILLIVILITHQWKSIRRQDFKYILLRSVFGFIGFLGAFVPIIYLSIGTFYFINYAGIVIGGYIAGWLFMKEKITTTKLISLFIALFGLLLIYSFSINASKIMYLLFAFIGGIGTACWNIFSKKTSGFYTALQLNLLDFILFSFIGLIFSIILREQWVVPELSTVWFAMLGFIFIFLITGQLIITGFKYIDSQKGSLIMLLEIVFGIIFAYLFFKESVSIFSVLGGFCITLSILLPEFIREKNY